MSKKERNERYYLNHLLQVQAYKAKWYQDNKKKVDARTKKYKQTERYKEWHRNYMRDYKRRKKNEDREGV